MKIKLLTFIIASSLLTGCFPEDTPLPPYEADASVEQLQIPMATFDERLNEYTYKHYFYLDLKTGTLQQAARASWDLGFETSPEGYRIILNTANYMQAANLGTVPFDTVLTEAGVKNLTYEFDDPSGEWARSAIGDWWNADNETATGDLYIINRGYDASANLLGYMKVRFEAVDESTFRFRYGSLDGSFSEVATITKDPDYNFSFFSLETGESVRVQPPKTDWDISFSYFSYRYPDGFPYWLSGVLNNRYRVQSASVMDSTLTFETLTLADTSRVEFTTALDEIGFDWKEYLFGPPARYVTYSDMLYFVRDTEGYYYKLRFLDFYNDQGIRGFPTMEYVRL